ncbi:MAG: transposase [Pyrinomonadaceae bacterium]|nr:transposase [Pyrinomonadaceae bacterium]
MEKSSPKGWYSRGYLPHFDGGETLQFVTFRLFDSLPKSVLEGWILEFERNKTEDYDVELRKRIEKFLDQGYGSCFLKNDEVAFIVEDTLLFHDKEKYNLIAWVVMPNHVHFLARSLEDFGWSEIMHSIKSYTSKKANKILQRTGRFWQVESFDRYIRNYEHFTKTIDYIENNPVKAGLCAKKSDWRFSSAFPR